MVKKMGKGMIYLIMRKAVRRYETISCRLFCPYIADSHNLLTGVISNGLGYL